MGIELFRRDPSALKGGFPQGQSFFGCFFFGNEAGFVIASTTGSKGP